VVPYPPELDFFLANFSSSNSSYFKGTNTMSQNQYTMLFEEDNTSLRTLLSPINLHAFYEWYKQGDFVSIKKRFSYDPKHSLSNFEIEGIFNYLEYLVENNVKNGSKDKYENSADYTAYGSLWAQMMKKVKLEIT